MSTYVQCQPNSANLPKSMAQIPVPVPRSITRCGFFIGARYSFRCNNSRYISCNMSRRSFSDSSFGSKYAKKYRSAYKLWSVRPDVISYTHRGTYGTGDHFHADNRARMRQAIRCTMICMSKNMRKHVLGFGALWHSVTYSSSP